MTGPDAVSAGWYPDPTGRHQFRSWSGEEWTDQVADDGRTSSDPGTDAPPPAPGTEPVPLELGAVPAHPQPEPGIPVLSIFRPPPEEPRPSRRKWWILSAASAVVVVMLAGAAVWYLAVRPGPGPVGLTVSSVSSSVVKLRWSPPDGRRPQSYVVRRDGAEIARVADSGYEDPGLHPWTTYHYTVLALTGGRLSQPTTELVVRTRPGSPVGVSADHVTTNSVTLHWSAPPDSTPDHFDVRRDGVSITTLPGTLLSYTDSTVTPQTDYSFTVVTVIAGESSDPAPPVEVTTAAPPVDTARLQDSWDIVEQVSKSNSRLKVGESLADRWTFAPACVMGACDVVLSAGVGGDAFKVSLRRQGAVYRGSAKVHIFRCASIAVSNTLSMTVRVTGGQVRNGTWTASKWEGSFELSIPYTRAGAYYCPAQSVTFSVRPEAMVAASAPST